MRMDSITIPATETKLTTLFRDSRTNCQVILVQAPSANNGSVWLGKQSKTWFEMAPGDTAGLPISDLRELFAYSDNATEKLVFMIFE